MAATRVLILGCGYTGKRVAALLTATGIEVAGTTRTGPLAFDATDPETFRRLTPFNSGDWAVLHSIPTINGTDPTPALMRALSETARVVYLSTTGVYGPRVDVDENTPPNALTAREQLRLHAEQAVARAKSWLVLRPAAIYGPHRGIHSSMREGKYQLAGDGSNFVSRIHVDDLAAHCVAGLLSTISGAWPVADEEPCQACEIARFCSDFLGVPMPAGANPEMLGETRRANRRVDGSAVRRALGIQLRYPSYRAGIPACVAAEAVARDF